MQRAFGSQANSAAGTTKLGIGTTPTATTPTTYTGLVTNTSGVPQGFHKDPLTGQIVQD